MVEICVSGGESVLFRSENPKDRYVKTEWSLGLLNLSKTIDRARCEHSIESRVYLLYGIVRKPGYSVEVVRGVHQNDKVGFVVSVVGLQTDAEAEKFVESLMNRREHK